MRSRSLIPLILLACASTLSAQAPALFEAVLSGGRFQCFEGAPPTTDVIAWINPDRIESTPEGTRRIRTLASAGGSRVLGILDPNGPGFQIVELRPEGTMLPFAGPFVEYESASALAVGSNGRIFVLAHRAGLLPTELLVLSPSGAIEATHLLPGAFSLLVVAPDNCTLWYNVGDDVRRFNACTGTALPQFVTAPEFVQDLVLLTDGTVLVATEFLVELYSAAGTLIRTVVRKSDLPLLSTTARFNEIALSADQQTLYVVLATNDCFSSGADLFRLSFATGAILSRRDVPINFVSSLVLGGPAPSSHAANVPTASDAMLLLLAVSLAAAGVWLTRT